MTFPRIRSPGAWLDNSVIDDAELEQFDQNLSRALDGFAGGAYAPSSALSIGGAGLSLAGLNHEVPSGGKLTYKSGSTFRVDSGATYQVAAAVAQFLESVTISETLTVNDNIDLNGTLDVSGAAFFHGNVDLGDGPGDNHTVVGDSLSVFCTDIELTGTFALIGTATFSSSITVAGNALLNGDTLLGNGSGDFATVAGILNFGSNGRMRHRTPVALNTGADTSYTVSANGNHYWAQASGANRVYTFDKAAHAIGDWLVISWRATANTATINDGVGTIHTLQDSAAGNIRSVHLIHDGTNWVTVNYDRRDAT